MPRLKYIGGQPTTFRDAALPSGALARVGHLMPGQEFGVPDEVAERFLRRADVIEAPVEDATPDDVPEDAKAPTRRVRSAPADPEPAAPEAPADTPTDA
jgi:hypothetical protein